MRKAWLLGLGLFLAACSFTVTALLEDRTLQLPVVEDTRGKVVYMGTALKPSLPPVDVIKGIRVEGSLEASEPLNLTLSFYARKQDPNDDQNCSGVDTVYLCKRGPRDGKVGDAEFGNSRTANFTLQGINLLEAIKGGELWLGIAASDPNSSLPSELRELKFIGMKAYVTVGL
ncbi:MAG: hypothetical protein ACUVQC_00140 [Thermaceae bacterium]